MRRFFFRSAVAAATLIVGVTAAQPAAAQNKLNIVGTVNLYQLVAGPTGNLTIDFVPPPGPPNGVITVGGSPTSGNTGVFAALPTGLPGSNIDFVFGTQPGTTTPPVPFLTVGGYTFTATSFGPGTVPGTPIATFQAGGTLFAFLNVDGFVNGPGLAPNTPFQGGYSAQFPGQTLTSVINTIQNNPGPTGGIGNVSVSATFVTAVPEPATIGLMATGLLGLVGVVRMRRMQV